MLLEQERTGENRREQERIGVVNFSEKKSLKNKKG